MRRLETQKLKEVHGLMTHDQLNEKALSTELEKRGIPLPDGFEKIMALRSSLPPAQFKEAFDVQKYIEKRMDIIEFVLPNQFRQKHLDTIVPTNFSYTSNLQNLDAIWISNRKNDDTGKVAETNIGKNYS